MTHVLWYSNETPDIRGQGGQRRQYFQIRSLVEAAHDVTVVTLAGEQDHTSVSGVAEVRRLPSPRWVAGFPLPELRPRDRALFNSLRCDRMVVAHLESWQYLRRRGIEVRRPSLLDLHNVFSVWHAAADRPNESQRWRTAEIHAAAHFDTLSVCSAREARAITASTGVIPMVLSHGIDPVEWLLDPQPRADPVMKLFGNWNWEPNHLGLAWFFREVAPSIVDAGMLIEVAGLGIRTGTVPAGVSCVGRVPDVAAFLSDAWLVGVPVRSGVGAPVKFAEALASGAPVLATTDAADGTAREALMVSDDPAAWTREAQAVLRSPEAYRESACRRRGEVLTSCSWDSATEALRRWVAGA